MLISNILTFNSSEKKEEQWSNDKNNDFYSFRNVGCHGNTTLHLCHPVTIFTRPGLNSSGLAYISVAIYLILYRMAIFLSHMCLLKDVLKLAFEMTKY